MQTPALVGELRNHDRTNRSDPPEFGGSSISKNAHSSSILPRVKDLKMAKGGRARMFVPFRIP